VNVLLIVTIFAVIYLMLLLVSNCTIYSNSFNAF